MIKFSMLRDGVAFRQWMAGDTVGLEVLDEAGEAAKRVFEFLVQSERENGSTVPFTLVRWQSNKLAESRCES